MAFTWGMILVSLAVMLVKSCVSLRAVTCIVLHLAPLMSLWSFLAVSHISLIACCRAGLLLAVGLRRDDTSAEINRVIEKAEQSFSFKSCPGLWVVDAPVSSGREHALPNQWYMPNMFCFIWLHWVYQHIIV